MRVTVFTVTLGQVPPLRAPDVIDPSARYVCFTDQPTVPAPYARVAMPLTSTPAMDSRRIKILADHPALRDADATLWHDGSYRLLRDLDWVRRGLQHSDMVAMRHPRRTRIEDEAPIIARYGYLTVDAAEAHVARYRAEGFTEDVLTSAGLLARRVSPRVQMFNRIWWEEMQRWGGRDQGSVDYAAWKAGVRVQHVDGTIRSNIYAGWRAAEKEVCA